MSVIRIYGTKGSFTAKPFEVNTVDVIPEAIAEEEEIINSSDENNENQPDEQS